MVVKCLSLFFDLSKSFILKIQFEITFYIFNCRFRLYILKRKIKFSIILLLFYIQMYRLFPVFYVIVIVIYFFLIVMFILSKYTNILCYVNQLVFFFLLCEPCHDSIYIFNRKYSLAWKLWFGCVNYYRSREKFFLRLSFENETSFHINN